MAPEVLMKQGSTRASDVFSLGVTLCELRSGVVPYSDARTTTEQMHTILEAKYGAPPPPRPALPY
jgi:serine/threonine protein kinase